MTRYVLGFAFVGDRQKGDDVLLIKKAKPEWQKGWYNGLGGKIEPGEDGPTAMAREFAEESGIVTLPEEWRFFAELTECGKDDVLCYRTNLGLARDHVLDAVRSRRDAVEPLVLISTLDAVSAKILPNLTYLIHLARVGGVYPVAFRSIPREKAQ